MISLRPGRLPRLSGRVWLLLTVRAPRRQPRAALFEGGGRSSRRAVRPRRTRGFLAVHKAAPCPEGHRAGHLEPVSARDGGNMNEHQALRISGTDPAPVAPFTMGETPGATAPQKEYRSGVFAKSRRDAGGGWGLVLIDLVEPPRS